MASRESYIADIIFVVISSLITAGNLIVIPSLTLLIMFQVMGAFLPNVKQGGGESAFILAGLSLWVIPLAAILTFPLSYYLSMRLTVYVRHKIGWEIRHPRRLYLFSLLILFISVLLPVMLLAK